MSAMTTGHGGSGNPPEEADSENGRVEAAQTAFLSPRPNPFNPRTEIRYSLAHEGKVRIEVYDVRGRRVKVLVDDVQPASLKSISWYGDDDRGNGVASGTYLIRMDFDGQSRVQRLSLVR